MSRLIKDADFYNCRFAVFQNEIKNDYDYLYKNYYFKLTSSIHNDRLYLVEDLLNQDICLPLFTYKISSLNEGQERLVTNFCIISKEMISMINFKIEDYFKIPEDKCVGDYFKIDLDPVEQTITYSLRTKSLNKNMHKLFFNYDNLVYLNTFNIQYRILDDLKRIYVPLVSKTMLLSYEDNGYKECDTDNERFSSDWIELDNEKKKSFYFLDPISLKGSSKVRYINYKTDNNFAQADIALDNICLKLYSHNKDDKVIVKSNSSDTIMDVGMVWRLLPKWSHKSISIEDVLKDLRTFEKKVISKLCKKVFGKVDKSYYKIENADGLVTLYLDYNKFKNDLKHSNDMFKTVYVNTIYGETSFPFICFLHNRLDGPFYRFA